MFKIYGNFSNMMLFLCWILYYMYRRLLRVIVLVYVGIGVIFIILISNLKGIFKKKFYIWVFFR